MTRSKMNEARRRRQMRGRPRAAPPGPRRTPAVIGAQGTADPSPWGPRLLLMLGGCAFVVQAVGAIIVWRLNSAYSLAGMLSGNPLFTLIAFPVAEPVARRIAHAPRALRLRETLSAGAISLMVFVVVYFAALVLIGAARHGDYGDPNHPAWVVLILGVLGFSCAAGPLAYSRFAWRFLMPRKRVSSRP